ncbi:MAG: T9SS type A sorting domain-containing protein, partial [Bacteroidia bacterium]|nr:T9SS type A sorting domain-containing protein [Bacteroidia bacterium]
SALASGGDDKNGVATDAFGNVFVGGDFYGVNPFIVGTDSLPLTGTENVFVAKYSCGSIENVKEFSKEEEINLSPNPVTHQLTIESGAMKIERVEIYDVLGRLTPAPFDGVYPANSGTQGDSQSERSRRLSVDVSFLTPGIYFIKAKGEKEERVAKFVKE